MTKAVLCGFTVTLMFHAKFEEISLSVSLAPCHVHKNGKENLKTGLAVTGLHNKA